MGENDQGKPSEAPAPPPPAAPQAPADTNRYKGDVKPLKNR